MEALHTNPELASSLPFVRLFNGKDSKYVWYVDGGLSTRFAREKGASRETPPCLLCTHWVSTRLSHKSMPHCVRARCSSPTLTTSTCCAILIALLRSLCPSSIKQASTSTSARLTSVGKQGAPWGRCVKCVSLGW